MMSWHTPCVMGQETRCWLTALLSNENKAAHMQCSMHFYDQLPLHMCTLLLKCACPHNPSVCMPS